MNSPSAVPHYQFVTGRLAEPALRRVVAALAAEQRFDYTVDVLPITVAALMTPDWIGRRLKVRPGVTQIVLPGYCDGNLTSLRTSLDVPVVVGPRDLHALPEHFGATLDTRLDDGAYTIEIIAEINHAPRQSIAQIRQAAAQLRADGADVIDLGCQPGETWRQVGDYVQALRDDGYRVSIDSLNAVEIQAAVRHGAELVLSVNRSNRNAAVDWGCEVVAIPDDPANLDGLEETLDFLESNRVAYRVDPILEPIGFGFGASLLRYAKIRQDFPQASMLMGIGNLTELTEVDSAAVNLLLLAICEEWKIRSVLTTQVINWCRSSVSECDRARRLVHYAIANQTLPKHVSGELVLLRDARLYEQSDAQLDELANSIRDNNYRIFAEGDKLHIVSAGIHLRDIDPFDLFQQLLATDQHKLDLSHAFYLGYELSKALNALTLGKQYRQDESLNWGFLTRIENRHPPSRRNPKQNKP